MVGFSGWSGWIFVVEDEAEDEGGGEGYAEGRGGLKDEERERKRKTAAR